MHLPTTPSFRLDGKRALVTGAGRGLGLACAAGLAEAGAHVTLCARTAAPMTEAAAAIAARGGRAEVLVLDVTDVEAVRAKIGAQAPYDILLNNAGTNKPLPFADITPENYDLIMGLNVRAALFVAQAVAKGMVAAGRGGSIIHMSSQVGHVGTAGRAVYVASKHALEGLSKAMAIDLARSGIRVNTISPTFIETEMTRNYFRNEAFLAETLSKIKLGRLGQVEDLLGGVIFLASDASAMITGTSLRIDGGWTAG